MTKFKILIDHDATKDGAVPGNYFNGEDFVGGPVMGFEAEVDIEADVSAGGMGDIMALQEFIKKDMNSMVMNVNSSHSYNAQVMHQAGGSSFAVPGPPNATISMKIMVDPLIQNMRQFQTMLESFLNKRSMFLSRIRISTSDRDILYGAGEGPFASTPTFVYKPTEIECSECHGTFVHTELKKEDGVWGDGAYQRPVESDTVCPKCGAWDCCELEFEQLPC